MPATGPSPSAAAGDGSPSATASPSKSAAGAHRDPQHGTHRGAHHDAQVEQIADDVPPATLCDVVCDEMLPPGGGRQRSRPILSRILLVGEVTSREDPPRGFFEDVLRTSAATVNAADPLQGKIAGTISDKMNISGIFFDLPSHFVTLLESEPQHLHEVMNELHRRLVTHKSYEGIANVHVAFYSDDIIQRGGSKWLFVDLASQGHQLPATGTSGAPPAGKLEEVIVDQLHKLLAVNRQAQGQPANHMETFLSNLRTTHLSDMPRPALVERVIKSGLCLNVQEYFTVFAETPTVTRGVEVLHPVEPPLFY